MVGVPLNNTDVSIDLVTPLPARSSQRDASAVERIDARLLNCLPSVGKPKAVFPAFDTKA